MRSEWAYYEAKLSGSECRDIVDRVSDRKPSKGTIGIEESKENKGIRNSEVIFINRTERKFADIFHIIDYCVDEANDEFFGVDYNRQGARALQFTIYRGNGVDGQHFYNTHQDTSLLTNGRPTQRKLSVTVQLSNPEDYEGGDFFMEKVDHHPPKDIIRKQGTILIFPSLILHGVTPVTQGVRYSLVGWYLGNGWK